MIFLEMTISYHGGHVPLHSTQGRCDGHEESSALQSAAMGVEKVDYLVECIELVLQSNVGWQVVPAHLWNSNRHTSFVKSFVPKGLLKQSVPQSLFGVYYDQYFLKTNVTNELRLL